MENLNHTYRKVLPAEKARKEIITALPFSLVWAFGVVVFIYLLLSPALYFKIGNKFFGEIPKLYNVKLAQLFFTYASYPVFGKAIPYAHYQLSRTYFIQGKLDPALSEAKKEIEDYPNDTRTYYIIGLTLGYMNRGREAIDAFGKFIAYKPGSWAARNDQAWLQFRIGDIDGALKTITPVSNLTGNPWVQNTYGALLLNKKRYPEAKKALGFALDTANKMTEESWGKAYPGNDPRVYESGLSAMKVSIENNLKLVNQALVNKQ